MISSNELALKQSAYMSFRYVLETYTKMLAIYSVHLYYDGYSSTEHREVKTGNEVSVVVRTALVAHWRRKLDLELANLKTFGVDASAEMPEEVRNADR